MESSNNHLIHSDPRSTEVLALEKISPHLRSMKRDIVAAIIHAGEDGLIPEQFPGLINTVRRRFTELWKEGVIRPTNLTRKNERGNECTIWVMGRDEELVVRETKDQIIARLRKEIARLSEVINVLNYDRTLTVDRIQIHQEA